MSLKHLFREYLGEDDSLEGVELTSQPRSSEPVVVVSAPPTVVVAPVQTQLVDVPTDETPVKVGLVQPWFCKSFFVFSVCSFGRHLAHESLWYRSAVCRPSFSLRFWSFFFFFSFPFPLGPVVRFGAADCPALCFTHRGTASAGGTGPSWDRLRAAFSNANWKCFFVFSTSLKSLLPRSISHRPLSPQPRL